MRYLKSKLLGVLLAALGVLALSANPAMADPTHVYDAEITGGLIVLLDESGPMATIDLEPNGDTESCGGETTIAVLGALVGNPLELGHITVSVQSRSVTRIGFWWYVELVGTTLVLGEYLWNDITELYDVHGLQMLWEAHLWFGAFFNKPPCPLPWPTSSPDCSIFALTLLGGHIYSDMVLPGGLGAGDSSVSNGSGVGEATGCGLGGLETVHISDLTLENFVLRS